LKTIFKYFKENRRDIKIAIVENYFYGFAGWMIPVSVSVNFLPISLLTAYIFYSFLSIIINREKYQTNLGKYVFFPLPATIGAGSAVMLGRLITSYIN